MATVQAALNQKQANTKGLVKLVKLKIGAKVMSSVYIDVQGCLINDRNRNIRYTEFALGSVCRAYVKFSDKHTGLKWMRSSYLCRQKYWFLSKSVKLRSHYRKD